MAETKWPTPEELEAIYNSTSEDEPRSRLENYRELIFKWRQQGRSYRRIRELLVAHCQLQVSASMLAKFVKTRVAREQPRDPVSARASEQITSSRETQIFEYDPTKPLIRHSEIAERQPQGFGLSPEQIATQRARIAALRNAKPVAEPTLPKRRFTFDPDKHRTNEPPKE